MKTHFCLIGFWLTIALTSLAQQTQQATNVSPATPYSIVQRDANSQVWERTTCETLPSGKSIPQVHHVTEIATGLNYWDGTQWSPSDPTFQISADGQTVFANKLQHKVVLSANLNGSNSVNITTPDGIVLNTTLVAVGLYDSVSGNSLIIAAITNCSGTLISSNQVLYENAFNGISGDVIYTLQRGSFSQDIVWKQSINPTDYGFSTNSTRIQIFTAFNSPPPAQIARPLYVETNQTVRAQMADPDFIDHTLMFGQLKFGPGRAFSTSATNRFAGAPIAKDFETINGQSYLIESIEYNDIKKELQTLPQVAVSRTARMKSQSRDREEAANLSPKARAKGLKNLVIPTLGSAAKATFAIKTGKNMLADVLKPNGVIADYVVLPATEPDPMIFQGDTTYFVDGPADFEDAIFEGGTIIKYPNDTNAYVEVDGNLTCATAPYRPAIFTAADDDSVGFSMNGVWPNYTGTIQPGGYANPALDIEIGGHDGTGINNLRINDAVTGVFSEGGVNAMNLQVINCGTGFNAVSEGGAFENVVIVNAGTAFAGYQWDGILENVTIVNCGQLVGADTDGGTETWIYNSILANVTNLVVNDGFSFATGTNNGFYNCNNNGIGATNLEGITTNIWPFQTVGSGSYYLTNGCVFRGAGTTNIDPVLLADITNKTTWPPFVYDNTNISSLAILSPDVPRDTNSSLDLGYHYDPLDYAFGGCDLYSNLTFTTGTAVGWFCDNGTSNPFGRAYAISLNDGANLSFSGNATQPCIFAFYDMVQEGGTGNWTDGEDGSLLGGVIFNGSTTTPQWSANFTRITGDNEEGLFNDNSAKGAGGFLNCEFYNCSASTYHVSTLNCTNCLFFRDDTYFWNQGTPISFDYVNCTFYDGLLAPSRLDEPISSFWLIENCSFDGTLLVYLDYYNGATNRTAFEYNAYNTNNLSWQTEYFPFSNWTQTNTLEDLDSSSIMATNFNWETSWFGNFYLPTNSPLLYMGSTNANLLGLYHFTTQTNQTIDGTNVVTIGYHYVATDANGNPLDSNGDGIPDYLEDPSGRGILGPQIVLTAPITGAFYTEPANIPMQAIVSDWSGLVTNVDLLQSNSLQGAQSIIGITNTPYTYTWPVVAANAYSLKGIALDNSGLSATSTVVSVTVTNLCGY